MILTFCFPAVYIIAVCSPRQIPTSQDLDGIYHYDDRSVDEKLFKTARAYMKSRVDRNCGSWEKTRNKRNPRLQTTRTYKLVKLP